MPLITCPDCGKQISPAAASCPSCGRPQSPTVIYNPRQDRFLTRNRGFFETLFWLILFVSIFYLLFGCAPSTVQGLRDNPAGKVWFEVDENYQSVYRKILTPARNCYQTGAITGQQVVQGDLFTDTRQGNVTIAMHSGAGVDTYLTVDIAALSDTKTKVTAYYAFQNSERNARAVELWVKNNSTECRAPEKVL